MSISIECEAAHPLRRPAQLNGLLFFILTAMAMPFHASIAADTPPNRGVISTLHHESVTEPAKTEAPPKANKCLLTFGDAPLKTRLLPGLSKGIVDPGAVSAADASAKTRFWSAPDPQEVGVVLHYVEISGARFQVRGDHEDSPPYRVKMLVLRDPAVALPCGLRVGQPVDQFIKALGQPANSTQHRPGSEIEYAWDKYAPGDGFEFAWHANIVFRLGPKLAVQEILWEYFTD